MGDAHFARLAGGYRAAFPHVELEFVLTRLRWERDDLHAELRVGCGLAGARTVDGLLSVGTFNLSSQRARRDQAKYLSERARTRDSVDMLSLLEETCQRVLKAERHGEPAVLLRDVPRPTPDAVFDIDGLRLPIDHPAILFGDGGSAKSLLALWALGTLARRGRRVAMFDWELDAPSHRARLEHLFPGEMPDVRYVRCDRPLVHEVDRLRAIIADDRLDYAVLDSVGFACAGPPESAEHALALARAARQLGIGSLQIAHIRQERPGESNEQRPFGSAFWHNAARATWFIKLADTSPDGQRLTIGCYPRKNNLGALARAVGFVVEFRDTRITIDPIAVADVRELAEGLPLWQRLKASLTRGPRTLAELADDLGSSVETLDRNVRRRSELFCRVSGSDGIRRVALVERRAS